jgi:hypothetical protein
MSVEGDITRALETLSVERKAFVADLVALFKCVDFSTFQGLLRVLEAERPSAEMFDVLKRMDAQTFDKLFGTLKLNHQQASVASIAEPPLPQPEPLPKNRWDERGFLLPQFRTPGTLMPKNRPGPPPPDFSKREGWAF